MSQIEDQMETSMLELIREAVEDIQSQKPFIATEQNWIVHFANDQIYVSDLDSCLQKLDGDIDEIKSKCLSEGYFLGDYCTDDEIYWNPRKVAKYRSSGCALVNDDGSLIIS